MRKLSSASLAIAAIGLGVSSSAMAVITIDNFTPGMVAISADSGTPVASQLETMLPVSDVIGGSRLTSVHWQSGEIKRHS